MNTRASSGRVLLLGLDFGSTTAKSVVLDEAENILFSSYTRHFSDASGTALKLLREIDAKFPGDTFRITVSGSSGMGLSEAIGLHFEQEVIAATTAIRKGLPLTDVAIELGGEDAKITFLRGSLEQRMNETCAGGTGAFIDQMAEYLKTDAAGLDALASKGKPSHVIASRCGVFARTDVVLLLNEGASREDIAASIFQSVVNQTISGLACGRAVKGHVAFLGGPLHYLPQLRQRFVETLKLTPEEPLTSEIGHLFVAYGSAIAAEAQPPQTLAELIHRAENHSVTPQSSDVLKPLFASAAELAEFRERHAKESVKRRDISTYSGDVYAGIDMGSTTLKAVLTDPDGAVLYTYYDHTRGDPLGAASTMFRDLYAKLPPSATIVRCGATGYGANLLCEIFGADFDEVETAAHCRAASEFQPGATFLLDIGGQDMKCIYLKDGDISRVFLNEACSSGCGVFIETLSKSLQLEKDAFISAAAEGRHPIDLGTRCTVFMNSKVRQAQKEGATVGDIAAGLAYAVVRNALHKVIKVASPADLGEKIVVQGGSFYNDALLRAFENSVEREVCRPDIAGLMGAYGMALFAIAEVKDGLAKCGSGLLSRADAANFTCEVKHVRCGLCGNRCPLQISTGSNGRRHVFGNRCERGAGRTKKEYDDIPNLYAFKYKRLFEDPVPLALEAATRGRIGIPRALNIFENYPFWFALFTSLGYRVELSAESSQEIFRLGSATIPSQTVCYPAKLAHGHVIDLIERGIETIFYPCIIYENKEFADSPGQFNCPVVAGYPELLRLNLDILHEKKVKFVSTFVPLENMSKLAQTLAKELNIPVGEIKAAIPGALKAQEKFRSDMRTAGEAALKLIDEKKIPGIVLAGHPYHIDPEVHHGIPEEIISRGCAVLTEDSIAHCASPKTLRVIDQWTYHSRLYRAASLLHPNLYLIQLTSFGCGLDALTSDQVQEIVESDGKPYTLLKLDEGANLGAARIRIRSLLRAIKARSQRAILPHTLSSITREKRDTILAPQLSPIHLALLEPALQASGYNVQILTEFDRTALEMGLRYVNNDACYPALIVIGQLIHALKSGKYDLDKTAVMLPRTGGSCRATNYTSFMEKALRDSGLNRVAILPLEFRGVDGIGMTFKMLPKGIASLIVGDLISRLLYRVRPYEVTPGTANRTAEVCIGFMSDWLRGKSKFSFRQMVRVIISRFAKIPLRAEPRRPRVGIVGEILVKYHPESNNHLVELIEREGGEVVSSDMVTFLLYCLHDDIFASRDLGKHHHLSLRNRLIIKLIESRRNIVRNELKAFPQFDPPAHIYTLAEAAEKLTSIGLQAGEGWLIVGESLELFEQGVTNVLSVQPFGCLANHVCAKGMMKALRTCSEDVNITAIDYDPGASEVNQINRIRLFMTAAKENLAKRQ